MQLKLGLKRTLSVCLTLLVVSTSEITSAASEPGVSTQYGSESVLDTNVTPSLDGASSGEPSLLFQPLFQLSFGLVVSGTSKEGSPVLSSEVFSDSGKEASAVPVTLDVYNSGNGFLHIARNIADSNKRGENNA